MTPASAKVVVVVVVVAVLVVTATEVAHQPTRLPLCQASLLLEVVME